jgi:ArsR family transcriptional regulator, arsenate/arsenite/antimonite-responsive transcriptional repressor
METLTRPTTRNLPVQAASCCGITVPRLSTAQVALAARRFKALGDPTRLTILSTLVANDEPVCACDLGDDVDLEQPTVAHHLKVLRDAGLVVSEKQGKWAYYSLHPEAAAWVRATVAAMG